MDAGDAFAAGGLIDRDKSAAMLEAMSTMGYSAFAIGEREFAHGLDFLSRQIARYQFIISSNVVWAKTREPLARPVVYKAYRLKAVPGRPARTLRVAVLAFLTPKQKIQVNQYLARDAARIEILDPIAEARRLIPQVQRKADLIVVLAHMNEEDCREFAKSVPGITVIVMGDMPGVRKPTPEKVGGALLVANGARGQFMGKLTLALDSAGKIEKESGTEVTLDTQYPDDKAMAELLRKADRATLAKAQTPTGVFQQTGPVRYVGSAGCVQCHKPQAKQWMMTAHAKAHAILARRGEQNLRNPECQRCHSLGYGEPGGFVSIDASPGLANVQCESCHGPGVNHVKAKDAMQFRSTIRRQVPAFVCTACHDEKNDPHFNYEKKLPPVKH